MPTNLRGLTLGGAAIALVSAMVGALVSADLGGVTASGFARGAFAGIAIAVPLYLANVWLEISRTGRRLRRGPFVGVVAVRTALALVIVVAVLAMLATVLEGSATAYLSIPALAIALLATFLFNVTWQLNRALGPGALANLVTGRYHQPRLEERVFLFMDLQGSTTIAERLGPVRFLSLLDRIAFDISEPVLATRGEIHRYVGDEVIVTWHAVRGIRDGACVRTAVAMLDAVAANAAVYRREFGVEPGFHVALHVGPVAVGQVGDVHRELMFLGDTVNTTARLEAASGPSGEEILISGPLIEALSRLPPHVEARALGPMLLRGREDALEVWALRRRSPDP